MTNFLISTPLNSFEVLNFYNFDFKIKIIFVIQDSKSSSNRSLFGQYKLRRRRQERMNHVDGMEDKKIPY